jgi:eukaryotic-like serine/threonine-protein kinase
MGFLKFLMSKVFLKHFSIAILLLLILIFIIGWSLNFYTQHGKELEVPPLTGINYDEIKNSDLTESFQFVVIDSVYDDHFNKGEIVLQDPIQGSKVKKGRKIYLTTVATQPENVSMPNLKDLSLRQALNELRANGLKLEKLTYIKYFARNAVVAQLIDGDTILPGDRTLKGTPVELILGKGLQNDLQEVPFLIGLTEQEAIRRLNLSSFNVGYLTYDDSRDKLHTRVYQQQPPGIDGQKADYGSYIDLWFRSDLYFNFDSLILTITSPPDSLEPQEIKTEELFEDE